MYSHQEIARDRHADLLREATSERLAATIREGDPDRTVTAVKARMRALRWVAAVREFARRPAVRTA
jgi:hypothetical protein